MSRQYTGTGNGELTGSSSNKGTLTKSVTGAMRGLLQAQSKDGKEQKQARHDRRKELSRLLNENWLSQDNLAEEAYRVFQQQVLTIINNISNDDIDNKKFDACPDEGPKETLFATAVRLGHLFAVAAMFEKPEAAPRHFFTENSETSKPIALMLLEEMAPFMSSPNLSATRKVQLEYFAEILFVLLKNSRVDMLRTFQTAYEGKSFNSQLRSLIVNAVDKAFCKQDILILRILNVMASASDENKRLLLDRFNLLHKSGGTPLAYLYHGVAKENLDGIAADFLSALMETGIILTIADSFIVNKMIWVKRFDLCIALLEGAILSEKALSLSVIQMFFEEHKLIAPMLDYCVREYIEKGIGEAYIRVIHFLLSLAKDENILKRIQSEHALFFNALKDIGLNSKHPICISFNEMMKRIGEKVVEKDRASKPEPEFNLSDEGAIKIYAAPNEITARGVRDDEQFRGKLESRISRNTPENSKDVVKTTQGKVPAAHSYQPPTDTTPVKTLLVGLVNKVEVTESVGYECMTSVEPPAYAEAHNFDATMRAGVSIIMEEAAGATAPPTRPPKLVPSKEIAPPVLLPKTVKEAEDEAPVYGNLQDFLRHQEKYQSDYAAAKEVSRQAPSSESMGNVKKSEGLELPPKTTETYGPAYVNRPMKHQQPRTADADRKSPSASGVATQEVAAEDKKKTPPPPMKPKPRVAPKPATVANSTALFTVASADRQQQVLPSRADMFQELRTRTAARAQSSEEQQPKGAEGTSAARACSS